LHEISIIIKQLAPDSYPNPAKEPRNGTADLLKGLAVLFMIQVHILEQFGTTESFESMIGRVILFLGGPPCAPVFIAIMGYYLASSTKNLQYFLKRGISLFVAGLLLNVGRSANLLIHIATGQVQLDPLFYILSADILTLAGLSIIIIGALRKILRNSAWGFIIVALAIALVSSLLPAVTPSSLLSSYLLSFFINAGPSGYFPFIPWFAYVLTGYAFHLFMKLEIVRHKLNPEKYYLLLIPLSIFLILTIPWASAITNNLEAASGYYHHGVLFFGWVLLFILSYLVIVKSVDNVAGKHFLLKWVKWFGENVTLVYIIQWLIIGNLATELYRTQNVIQMVLWFISISLLTFLLSFGYVRFRFFFFRKRIISE